MLNPRRVVVVTHYFSSHGSGLEQVAAQLGARISQQAAFEIDWFASDCDPPPDPQPQVRTHPMPAWYGLERLGIGWPVWRWAGLVKLRAAIRSADIVHVHEYIYFNSIIAFLLAKYYRKPVVITQHVGHVPFKNPLLFVILWAANHTIGRLMLAWADKTIFISAQVQRYFSPCVPRSDCWPNGVDTAIFQPLPDDERERRRLQKGVAQKPVFLFAGRFVSQKGLLLLRELAAAFPDVLWWFAGKGDVQSECHPQSWGLPNVEVFSGLREHSLAELYQLADLLVLPSYGEGFPLVVQEAMACGTPAIVSPETAAGAPAAAALLFTCPLEPAGSAVRLWKEALQSLLDSPQMQQRRRHVADIARQQWCWDSFAANYVQLFNTLVGSKRS